MQILTRCLLLGSFVGVGLTGCGKAAKPKPVKQTSVYSSEEGTGKAGAISSEPLDRTDLPEAPEADKFPSAPSLTAYKTHVYEPVIATYCIGCHDSTFAAADIEAAHKAFLKRMNFDQFNGIDNSLPVVKMKQGHNCWDAKAQTCVTAMSAAIGLWLKDLEANGYVPVKTSFKANSTQVIMQEAAVPVRLPIPIEYVTAGLDSAIVAAPFVKSEDSDGPIKFSAAAPADTKRLNAANNAQAITFNLDVKSIGNFYVWIRAKTPAATSKQFFVQLGDGPIVPLIMPVTGNEWKWFQVMRVANNVSSPYAVNIATMGQVSGKVFFSEGGAAIDQFAITSKDDFNGGLISNQYYEIAVPLNIPGVTGATIIATVWEQTTGLDKKSLGVKQLRVDSPLPLHVKGIYPLFNDEYHQNQNSYKDIDVVAGGPDASKSLLTAPTDSAAIWLVDFTKDKLSFGFDTLEIAK